MKSEDFNQIEHRLGVLERHTSGEMLGLGYRPNLSARHEGVIRLILENLPRTDLKALFGAYQRAEKFSRDARMFPSLVIVVVENGRYSVNEASEQLREFAAFWQRVTPPGGVREVLLLSDRAYRDSARRRVVLLSPEFRALCQTVVLRADPVATGVQAQPLPAPAPLRMPEREPARARTDRPEGISLNS